MLEPIHTLDCVDFGIWIALCSMLACGIFGPLSRNVGMTAAHMAAVLAGTCTFPAHGKHSDSTFNYSSDHSLSELLEVRRYEP